MTAKKHEVDPATQGSMLAPTPAALATGVMVELEDAYYSVPEKPQTTLTSEQEKLKAEANAIFFLDKACGTKRNIVNMEKYQRALKAGNVIAGTDIATERARLARRENKGGSVGAIPTAQEHYKHFRRQAKIAFGLSVGIETVTEQESRLVDGVPQEVTVVKAEDPEQQSEFVEGFREFDKLYGQANQSAARDQRRQEIQDRFSD